ncbi:TRAP transporter substrate-binding protein [Candidatus Latescibacterota bacterium]
MYSPSNITRRLFFSSIIFFFVIAAGCRETESPGPGKLVFRFALQPDPANKVWVAANLFRQEIERRSNGDIEVKFYDSGVLGAERQLLEACYMGVIEMVQVTSSVVTTIDPVFSTLDMPYLFVNEDHHRRILNGPIGRELLDGLSGVRFHGISFFSCGFRHMFNSKRSIYSPDDMAGLKIRVMESPVMLRSINCLGGSATPLDASEVYTALKTGVVDGAENNSLVFVSSHYSDSCKYLSMTGHFANQHVLIANKAWYEALATEHRELIDKTAVQILHDYNLQWHNSVTEAMKTMEQIGVTVNGIDDIRPFMDLVQPVYDEYKDSVPPELVRRIRKEADK